jgi:RsiW-degrading membrane proteinase PrsW (M82 family)/TPR repeat protein
VYLIMSGLLIAYGVFSLAFAPGVFWLWIVARKDKHEPEPVKYIVAMFCWGMLSGVAAGLLNSGLIWTIAVLDIPMVSGPILVAPLTEESIKLAFLLIALRSFKGFAREFDEPMDGIVYAACVALGFASFENAIYLGQAYAEGVLARTAIARAMLSVPGHLLDSSIWGYALGMVMFSDRTGIRRVGPVLVGLAIAMVFHGGFNLLASLVSEITALVLGLLVVAYWFVFHQNVRRALAVSPHRPGASAAEKARIAPKVVLGRIVTARDVVFALAVATTLLLATGVTAGLLARHEMRDFEAPMSDGEYEELLREIDQLLADQDLDGGAAPDAGHGAAVDHTPLAVEKQQERHCWLSRCVACGSIMGRDRCEEIRSGQPRPSEEYQACIASGLEACHQRALEIKSDGPDTAANEQRARSLLEELCFAGHSRSCNALGEYWHLVANERVVTVSSGGRSSKHDNSCSRSHTRLCDQAASKWKVVPAYSGLRDSASAKCLFEIACDDGLVEGCLNYVETDKPLCSPDRKEIEAAEKACEAGLFDGCEHLAFKWERGWQDGWEQRRDLAKTRKYHEFACAGGIDRSCYRLGVMWRDGQGGAVDTAKARQYFERLCGYGETHPQGCEALVELGVPNKDPI